MRPSARRCPDGDQRQFRSENGGTDVGRCAQPPAQVPRKKSFDAPFEERHLAPLDLRDPACVGIHADHIVPELREADARHEPDVAGSDHCDVHADAATRFPMYQMSERVRPSRSGTAGW